MYDRFACWRGHSGTWSRKVEDSGTELGFAADPFRLVGATDTFEKRVAF